MTRCTGAVRFPPPILAANLWHMSTITVQAYVILTVHLTVQASVAVIVYTQMYINSHMEVHARDHVHIVPWSYRKNMQAAAATIDM